MLGRHPACPSSATRRPNYPASHTLLREKVSMSTPDQKSVSIPVPAAMSAEQFTQLLAAFTNQITTSLGQQQNDLGKQIADGINAARPKKVTAGQYDPRTPFHPNKKAAKKLRRPVYQNGSRLHANRLFDREIDLLNKIVRSGRYINRLIEIQVRQDGPDEVVDIRYKNRTIDDRMEHKGAYRDLTDMLTQIVNEQDAALAQEGEVKEARRSFNSAATREARARAAANAADEQPLEP